MSSRFEIIKRPTGRDGERFEARFKAPNGTAIMTTPRHATRDGAMGNILAIRALAAGATIEDLTRDD